MPQKLLTELRSWVMSLHCTSPFDTEGLTIWWRAAALQTHKSPEETWFLYWQRNAATRIEGLATKIEGGRGRRISVSSRPAWSTKWVPGQPGLHRQTLSQKTKSETNNWGLMIVLTSHKLKLEPYREDKHGPHTVVTNKFLRSSIFLTGEETHQGLKHKHPRKTS